ncbi:MAG: cytochrome B [Candidatus Niyogibacteria bacterium CG10_big_fil_rev_8_21_14_0_10_46_36]|uniref:Cytochrome B n=1 Tax=Candidatus Niyogibacteria bacterium CG10_big_fil_rev_8_21_14_0_10_46_36 TaxID=1974726 RepID=A0A2H0TED3_9BACT|nr:MAG: cytochrome B [Candidatus Niyogibacteria bacterium CG10_big_fil_rev_8_21_14_0_10_46_36]
MMEDAGDGVIEDGSMSDQVTLYTLTDVATHNTKDDCWLAIHGKVYDVTEFIPTHPGGPAIIQGCGKDATSMFESRPSSGTSHSETARALLPGFYIGDLATQ